MLKPMKSRLHAIDAIDSSPHTLLEENGVDAAKLARNTAFAEVFASRWLQVKHLCAGYLLAYAYFEPIAGRIIADNMPDEDGEDEDREIDVDPNDLVGQLAAIIISIEERRIVGQLDCEVFYFLDMGSLCGMDPANLLYAFDADSADRHAAAYCLFHTKTFRDFRHEPGNVIHIESIEIEPGHRGKGLALAALKLLMTDAAFNAVCDYALICPSPLGGAETEELLRKGRKKLASYYERAGFRKISARSEFMFQKIEPTSEEQHRRALIFNRGIQYKTGIQGEVVEAVQFDGTE